MKSFVNERATFETVKNVASRIISVSEEVRGKVQATAVKSYC